ncbi:MAG: adenylate kinase family protein [Christensenellales bacterium]
MKIILIGGPACGKGVQAKLICEKYNLLHISTGDLLRDEIKQNSPLSEKTKEIISNGELVSDDLIFRLVKNKIENSACDNYLLDGFPRTMNQAKLLSDFQKPDFVISLETDYDIALSRVLARRVCLNCKASLTLSELKNKHCPYCSGSVGTRLDDNADVFRKRFEIYKMQSAPLIKYYGEMGVLFRVQNNHSVNETFNEIDSLLKSKNT